MAGTRQPGHHASLRRNHPTNKASSSGRLHASRQSLRSTPPKRRMAEGWGVDEMAQFTLIVMWPLERPPPSKGGQILINGHKTGSGTKWGFFPGTKSYQH